MKNLQHQIKNDQQKFIAQMIMNTSVEFTQFMINQDIT